MSQHDFDIANQTASSTRADINLALKALGSLSSGSSAPSTTYANMLWYDTTNNTLKMRAEANDAWISVGYLDQSADRFRIFDDTQVVNSSGTQTGLIGDQATSAWEAGTSTTESLVSPAKIKAAIEQNTPTPTDNFGVNQTWQDVEGSRAVNTDYQAPANQAIQVSVSYRTTSTFSTTSSFFEVSSNGSTWLELESVTSTSDQGDITQATGFARYVIPANNYYRVRFTSGGAINFWYEMR